jgi:purine nucleosidase
MTAKTTYFIDTDAGVDDAIALLEVLQGVDFHCGAITTVAGNTDVHHVNRNVGCVLDLLQMDIPIYQGADRPMFQETVRADDIMGDDGLGGASSQLPDPHRQPADGHAVLHLPALIAQAAQSGSVNLITLGPLTNIALMIRLHPEMVQQVDRLVIMGGAIYGKGNSSPVAEFNFFCDPEAAAVVLSAGFNEVWLLPWEVSVQQPMLWDQYERIRGYSSPGGEFFRKITGATEAFLRALNFSGVPLPDLLAAAIAVDPALATGVHEAYVEVQYTKGTGYGLSAVDWHHLTRKVPNARVVTAVDADAIYARLEQKLLPG